jgi:hypothetical protein
MDRNPLVLLELLGRVERAPGEGVRGQRERGDRECERRALQLGLPK